MFSYARLAFYMLLLTLVFDFGRGYVCYKTVYTTQAYTVACGIWKAFRCTRYREVAKAYVTCCEGWKGDSCDLPFELECDNIDEQTNIGSNSTTENAPNFVPLIGNIKALINKTATDVQDEENSLSRIYFQCEFTPATAENLWYRATWYENDFQIFRGCYGQSISDAAFILTEKQFQEYGCSLGNQLSCDVRAYYRIDGPSGNASDRAKGLLVGIELLTPELDFVAGETVKIRFRSTIPIACRFTDVCRLRISTIIADNKEDGSCPVIVVKGRQCGISIQSNNTLDTVYELNITTADNGQYQTSDSYNKIILKVDAGQGSDIWKYYKPLEVLVHIRHTVTNLKGKICHSANDPHMTTFDGRKYELQDFISVYTLYMHQDYDSEIQIRLKRCNSDKALCNCGFAARFGRDSYKIDFCDSPYFMDYMTCGDNALKVKSNKEWKYKVIFPYGTFADVSIQLLNVEKIVKLGGIFLGIRITPSTQDSNGRSVGLCGSLDDDPNNDFTLRNGSNIGKDKNEFTKSWRVTTDEGNMFSGYFDVNTVLPSESDVCVCRNASSTVIENSLQQDPSCAPNAVAECLQGKNTNSDGCISSARLRRDVPDKQLNLQETGKLDNIRIRRRKREAQIWTNETAEIYCTEQIMQSPVYEKCSTIPHVRPEEDIHNCVLDTVLTQESAWAAISVETMQEKCLSELQRNTTLSTSDDPNEFSIADAIKAVACQNNCSFAGICDNGECRCFDGFGGADCSLDFTIPPVIEGLQSNLCDERVTGCLQAYVYGRFFADGGGLKCRLVEFEMSPNGGKKTLEEYIVPAEFDSLIGISCPLKHIRQKRQTDVSQNRFVLGYTVYVSNDGILYGDGQDIYLYNSECQLPEVKAGNILFKLSDGFCFIGGECIPEGRYETKDNCYSCISNKNQYTWSQNAFRPDCILNAEHDQEDGESPLIWVILTVTLGITVAAVVAACMIHRSNSRVDKTAIPETQVVKISPERNMVKDNVKVVSYSQEDPFNGKN